MRNKVTLISALLFACSSVMADQTLLEGATKQLAKDAATSAAPDAVEGAVKAGQAVEQTKNLQEGVQGAPDAALKEVQDKAKETATHQIEAVMPEEIKQGVETVKSGADSAKQLKATVGDVPKSSKHAKKAVKNKAQQQATQKALEMVH